MCTGCGKAPAPRPARFMHDQLEHVRWKKTLPAFSRWRVPGGLMRIDVNAFSAAIPGAKSRDSTGAPHRGDGPYRDHRGMTSHLPGLFWRDPMEGNAWLYAAIAHPRLSGAAVHPGLRTEEVLGKRRRGAPARCDPHYFGPRRHESRDAGSGGDLRIGAGCSLLLAARLEDGRQRIFLRTTSRPSWLPRACGR